MFIIIGGDGKEYGPVSAEQIRSWIAGGRANLETKAKAVGSDEWRRLGDFPEFNGAGVPPPPISSQPVVVVSDARSFANDLIARAAPLDVFDCLGQSFTLWKAHFFALVGVTFLVLLVQFIAGVIPLIGFVANLLLNGVFYGGLYYYYLGKIRGESREVGDAFGGFTRAFVPLMLATLLTSLIMFALMLVLCAPVFMFIVQTALHGADHFAGLPTFSPLALLGIFVGFLVMTYLSVSWIFTFPLIIDQGLGPWTAMEVSRRVVGKQWFRVFFVMFLGGILGVLGVIALFIGVIFTLPLTFGAIAHAYEKLCRPAPRA